jgi:group I intron endonuclease
MPYVYVIKNKNTNKCYVGQTRHEILTKRLSQHFWLARRGKGAILHKSIRKHGEENFSVIESIECEKEQLNEIERQTIIKYNSVQPDGYNILAFGSLANLEEGWWKGKERAESTKEKLSEVKKEQYDAMTNEQQEALKEQGRQAYNNLSEEKKNVCKEKQRSWWANMPKEEKKAFVSAQAAKRIGHNVSSETRKKLSETHKAIGSSPVASGAVEAARLANTGKIHSNATKARMSAAKLGKGKSKETKANMTSAQRLKRTPEQIDRVLKIKEMLAQNISPNSISVVVGCTAEYVRKVRKGERGKGI